VRDRALAIVRELAGTSEASGASGVDEASGVGGAVENNRAGGAKARRRGPASNPELTDRELEVLAAIASGQTNAQIGAKLYLSPKTVMHHSANVYRKLGVRGRAEAVALAYRTGLLPAGGPGPG
jgi:DNA-binding NarL/FixJ family response regulator